VITLAGLLRPDRPVNLALIMLVGLLEQRQQHDRAIVARPGRRFGAGVADERGGDVVGLSLTSVPGRIAVG
jgi:hypothetical protein